MRAHIIVDLGFGDCGKGLLTDFLARQLRAEVVVRYNGGAQAGHNVVAPDGRHHTFSQFGSGTFLPRVRTYLSRHVVIHPTALLLEGELLKSKGIRDAFSRLRVSDQALVITPFHQATNRIRELVRGANRHGSCGVGVGEAVEDAVLHPESRVLAGDLTDPTSLRRKLRAIREQKRAEITALGKDDSLGILLEREWDVFERDDLIDQWIASITRIGEMGLVVTDSVLEHWLRESEDVIFEGAQGVLLDADAGFHPFTTWSRCTTANAVELIEQMAPDSSVVKIGVMRSYAVRHGPGPLPSETDDLKSVVSEHNQYNQWQGNVRYGWFDAVLARYAIDVTGGIDSLVVTHLDVLSHLKTWKYCTSYAGLHGFDHTFINDDRHNGILTNFQLSTFVPLPQREQFTQALSTVQPIMETCEADIGNVIQKIESLTGQVVGMISCGSSAKDIQVLDAMKA